MNEFEDLKRKKEKKDKKKGFITWFKEKLGFSPRGMGNVSEGARGINLAGLKGSAANIGAGRFGSAGLFFKAVWSRRNILIHWWKGWPYYTWSYCPCGWNHPLYEKLWQHG